MRVVIAPDSFKGSMSARQAARQIAEGWRSVRETDRLSVIPQADGGEGTLDAIEAAVPGSRRRDVGLVTGPDGRATPGIWLELPQGVAVVELAQVSGLPLMARPDPLGASTRGLGEVIRAAVASGIHRLVIGLGGSASTDGAAGALAALGLRGDSPLDSGGAGLAGLGSLDRSELLAPPPGGVILLTDVDAPLLGPGGAAAIFGPQKGASPAEVALLEASLAHFADLLGGDPYRAGSGAAGGCGFGFVTAWGARIVPGANYLADLTGLPEALTEADLLVIGEGRFDETSLSGKIVGRLIALAGEHGVPVCLIAGQVALAPVGADGRPIPAVSLSELAGSAGAALADPSRWLRAAGAAAAAAAEAAEA